MEIGASTGCLYPDLTEDAALTLAKLGFKKIEIFFNTFSELKKDYLQRLKSDLGFYDTQVLSLHPFTSSYESYLLFSGYERRFWDGVELYKDYFHAIRFLGGKFVVLHGLRSDFAKACPEELYFERFAALAHAAQTFGVTLVQENVWGHFSENPKHIRHMIEAIPNEARFVCDIKQAIKSGYSPLEMLDAMGSRTCHIHISDYVRQMCLLPQNGGLDFHLLFKKLQEIHYDGDVILEVYRQSFQSTDELIQSKKYLENIIKTV